MRAIECILMTIRMITHEPMLHTHFTIPKGASHMKQSTVKTKKFVAEIKWGVTSIDPPASSLPPEFATAKMLCEQHNSAAFELVNKYLICSFVPDNITGDLSKILVVNGQVDSSNVQIIGLSFKHRNLPAVRAVAEFELQTAGNLSQEKLEKWEDENEWLDNRISFYWDLGALNDEIDTFLTHQGSSFVMA